MLDFIKNNTIYINKYQTNSEAVVISCFFNPQNSPYRLKAFNIFYDSIKHLNHRIIECVIGDSKPQLPNNKNITRVYTKTLLWHKETLLNKIISELPSKFKYVFWVDADVIFTNQNWLTESVEQLEIFDILQPFEYCVHLDKDEIKPSFDMKKFEGLESPNELNKKVWRSFCANYSTTDLSHSHNYDEHGHVGFAWGAKREILDKVPLFERALIGGADHIIAHAAAGHIPHNCITKSFTENIDEINQWSRKFYQKVKGNISFTSGNLYHIWHGDIEKRNYFKRILEFTPMSNSIVNKDENGLYISNDQQHDYMVNYFSNREVTENNFTFGGGSSGGSGAGGSWEDNKIENNYQNFS